MNNSVNVEVGQIFNKDVMMRGNAHPEILHLLQMSSKRIVTIPTTTSSPSQYTTDSLGIWYVVATLKAPSAGNAPIVDKFMVVDYKGNAIVDIPALIDKSNFLTTTVMLCIGDVNIQLTPQHMLGGGHPPPNWGWGGYRRQTSPYSQWNPQHNDNYSLLAEALVGFEGPAILNILSNITPDRFERIPYEVMSRYDLVNVTRRIDEGEPVTITEKTLDVVKDPSLIIPDVELGLIYFVSLIDGTYKVRDIRNPMAGDVIEFLSTYMMTRITLLSQSS